jgi:hypothetical protein
MVQFPAETLSTLIPIALAPAVGRQTSASGIPRKRVPKSAVAAHAKVNCIDDPHGRALALKKINRPVMDAEAVSQTAATLPTDTLEMEMVGIFDASASAAVIPVRLN